MLSFLSINETELSTFERSSKCPVLNFSQSVCLLIEAHELAKAATASKRNGIVFLINLEVSPIAYNGLELADVPAFVIRQLIFIDKVEYCSFAQHLLVCRY